MQSMPYLKYLIQKKIYGEIFNIGYGKAIQIKKVILLIKKIVKRNTYVRKNKVKERGV